MKRLRRIVVGALAAGGAATFASGALAAPDARGHVYVDDNTTGTNTIAAFDRQSDGSLVPTPGSPFSTGGTGTGRSLPSQGAIQLTDDGRYVLAVDAGSNAPPERWSALADAADGTLTSIGASPYPDLQAAPCWVEISHDGRYLFAVNTASASLSRSEIADDGSLTLLGSTTFATTARVGATDARLGVDGGTLYVLDSAAPALAVFSVDGGDLTELSGLAAALPSGAALSGIAVL